MSLDQLTGFDYLIVVVILISTGFALTKGLASEVVSLVALVGGFLLAAFHYRRAAGMFADLARTDAVAHLLGFLIVFVGVLILGALVSLALTRLLKAVKLQWFDRMLGGLFGFVRGWAIVSVVALALVAFPVWPDAVSRSYLAPYLLAGARAAVVLVPRDLRDRFREEYRKVLDAWSAHRSSR